MKQLAVLIAVLLLAFSAQADIGPSPNYSFSINNASDYPDHAFYYAGNIWQNKLELVTDSTSVYKLNTTIKVYAVPNEITQGQTQIHMAEKELLTLVASEQIGLSAGHTEFSVQELNAENKTLSLEAKPSEPEQPSGLNPLLLGAIAIAALVILIVAVKKGKGK